MRGSKFSSKDIADSNSFFIKRHHFFLAFSLFLIFIVFFGGFGHFNSLLKDSPVNICGDGTVYNECSKTMPYFCLEGKLIDLALECGCPDNFVAKGEFCYSSYDATPKNIALNYTLRGEKLSLNFEVYEGFIEYVSKISPSITNSSEKNLSRADFKLKILNEAEQRKMILPLVIEIQNLTSVENDQMRIAVSLVQNIPFGYSNKTSSFGAYQINYSRYPYEVLYDMQGICGEKTNLLALLLREMGYGLSIFYYPSYNHEALGISCPKGESVLDSGYCFVETTGPSIVTDDKIRYLNIGKLLSEPEIYPLGEGKSLEKNLYEYSDANTLIKIRDSIEKYGVISSFKKKTFDVLKKKYGLADEYYDR